MWKSEKDNKYANISSYILQTDLMKYTIHSTNCSTKTILSMCRWSHSNKKKTIYNNRDTKDLKKYGCVYTCCHRSNLPWYNCIIFLRQNYNFNIPAVANALSKWYREIRQKEFICKPCDEELKDGNYSNNIQNCPNSDMFASDINHDKHTQDNVEQSRTHSTNNITCDFIANDTF